MTRFLNPNPCVSIARLLGGAALLSLGACGSLGADRRPPAGLEERIVLADPLHPVFEQPLHAGKGLFECLLSIDRFLCPQIDEGRVRAAFGSLLAQADRELARSAGGRKGPATAEEAACAFLKTLRVRGFMYLMAPASPGLPDSKMASYTLLERTGCCTTFSLLLAAYLDRKDMPSSIVCLPDHCFVRILHPEGSSDVESTDFESPLRRDYVNSGELEGTTTGGHYGQSLDPEKTLWHYYVDRLRVWRAWRVTDEFTLRSLGQARAVLGSSCQSIESQEALRYFEIARGAQVAQDRRSLAWSESYGRYERLRRIHPAEPDYALALAELAATSPGPVR